MAPVRVDGRCLALQGVTKRWPGVPAPVLDGIDLDVPPGTAVRIGGANGAGKTTLLRIAAGLIRPEHGRVTLGELDVDGDRTAFQRNVGFLSAASAGLYARLTVRDHLRFWARLALMRRDDRRTACARVIDAFELGALADRRVDRLSMGQRQRVRLAGALLHDPSVVLLDEPANSLDAEGTAVLVAELARLVERGGAVLWAAPFDDGDGFPFDVRLTVRDGRVERA
jgi:heme ABC exporter ATP-binding subunit CcmA